MIVKSFMLIDHCQMINWYFGRSIFILGRTLKTQKGPNFCWGLCFKSQCTVDISLLWVKLLFTDIFFTCLILITYILHVKCSWITLNMVYGVSKRLSHKLLIHNIELGILFAKTITHRIIVIYLHQAKLEASGWCVGVMHWTGLGSFFSIKLSKEKLILSILLMILIRGLWTKMSTVDHFDAFIGEIKLLINILDVLGNRN